MSQELLNAIDAFVARNSDGTVPPEQFKEGIINNVQALLNARKTEQEIIQQLNQ